jgi:hypothetical protein
MTEFSIELEKGGLAIVVPPGDCPFCRRNAPSRFMGEVLLHAVNIDHPDGMGGMIGVEIVCLNQRAESAN